MSHAVTVARLGARSILADVEVAVASGDWVVSPAADPAAAIAELQALLVRPASAESIARATDGLAACCGAAIESGDWLNPSNDWGPFDARSAVATAAANDLDGIDSEADATRLRAA